MDKDFSEFDNCILQISVFSVDVIQSYICGRVEAVKRVWDSQAWGTSKVAKEAKIIKEPDGS